jgi:hypothetical protein
VVWLKLRCVGLAGVFAQGGIGPLCDAELSESRIH